MSTSNKLSDFQKVNVKELENLVRSNYDNDDARTFMQELIDGIKNGIKTICARRFVLNSKV